MSTNNRAEQAVRGRNRASVKASSPSYLRKTLSDAIDQKIDLDGIDLRNGNLRGITIDGITLQNADFTGSDLSGANMSEAAFINCNFSHSVLFDTCFAYSRFTDCTFTESQFGQTDFSQAALEECVFSGTSIFTQNVAAAEKLSGCRYINDGKSYLMSQPPITLTGFKYPIILLDDKILIDGDVYDMDRADIISALHEFWEKICIDKIQPILNQ